MSKDPSVLFYTSDFLVGTMGMSNEQVGKYIRLLCMQHQYGGFLYEHHMKSVCGEFDTLVYSKFTKDSRGLYFNKRMLDEINKRVAFCDSRRNNLKKHGTKLNHFLHHMNPHMENENKDVNKGEEKEKEGVGKDRGSGEGEPREEKEKGEEKLYGPAYVQTASPVHPSTLTVPVKSRLERTMEDFCRHREALNKPFDDTTYGYFLKKLNSLSAGKESYKLALLGNAMSGGYPDIYPLSTDQQNQIDAITSSKSRIPKGKISVSNATEYNPETDGPLMSEEERTAFFKDLTAKIKSPPI